MSPFISLGGNDNILRHYTEAIEQKLGEDQVFTRLRSKSPEEQKAQFQIIKMALTEGVVTEGLDEGTYNQLVSIIDSAKKAWREQKEDVEAAHKAVGKTLQLIDKMGEEQIKNLTTHILPSVPSKELDSYERYSMLSKELDSYGRRSMPSKELDSYAPRNEILDPFALSKLDLNTGNVTLTGEAVAYLRQHGLRFQFTDEQLAELQAGYRLHFRLTDEELARLKEILPGH